MTGDESRTRAEGEDADDRFVALRILHELALFLLRPRTIVRRRKERFEQPSSVLASVTWCAAAFTAVWGVYGAAFGSLIDNLRSALAPPGADARPIAVQPSAPERASPPPVELVEWGWRPGVYVGIQLPELQTTPLDAAQRLEVQCGTVYVILDHVVPAGLVRGAFPLAIQGLFALVVIACLYPPARLLGSRTELKISLGVSGLYVAYVVTASSIVIAAAAILLRHALDVRGNALAWAWGTVTIAVMVVAVRSYFAGFAELFGISKLRLTVATLGATLASSIVVPVVFVPLLYLALRFQHVLDVFA